MNGGDTLLIGESSQNGLRTLTPSLYTLGNIRYRIGDKSISIYSFEDDSSNEDDRPEDEERLDCESDSDSVGNEEREVHRYPVLPDLLVPPADFPEAARDQLMDVGVHETSVQNAETAGTEKPSSDAADQSSEAQTSALPSTAPPLAYWVAQTSCRVARCLEQAKGAVIVGRCADGELLYVARAYHNGELLPGMVATRNRICHLASEGRELYFDKYEVLVLKRGRVEWVRGQNGSFPFDAFPAGLTLLNQRVYVARVHVNGILTPGRLVVGENECRVCYDSKEYKYSEYEVLTVRHLEPNENGMVRYVSAENLDAHHPKVKHFIRWCGFNSANEETDEEEEEDEEQMDEERFQ